MEKQDNPNQEEQKDEKASPQALTQDGDGQNLFKQYNFMRFKEVHGYDYADPTVTEKFNFGLVNYVCRKIATADARPGLWITQLEGDGHCWALFEASADAPLRASLFFTASELYCMRVQLLEENSHLFK